MIQEQESKPRRRPIVLAPDHHDDGNESSDYEDPFSILDSESSEEDPYAHLSPKSRAEAKEKRWPDAVQARFAKKPL